MATLFVWASLAGIFSAGAFFAAVEVGVDFFAGVFLAGEAVAGFFLAGAFRAVVFATGSDFFAALFSAAAERWGADFFDADVAMLISYPLPSSETEADWSQDSRPRAHHVPARRADRGHTVVGSSSPLDVPRVTALSQRLRYVTERFSRLIGHSPKNN
ncbi:hypothetical protein [Kribbella sp. NPDC000426]|uniref:hypothetical protein n=1 Tax=Kribbella sp. NPDC000426 TaxID=3154255 RepID=UPI00331B8CB8